MDGDGTIALGCNGDLWANGKKKGNYVGYKGGDIIELRINNDLKNLIILINDIFLCDINEISQNIYVCIAIGDSPASFTLIHNEESKHEKLNDNCKKVMLLMYEQPREKMQWTLDRINNGIGHHNDNVVISCLKCNLKKRTTDSEKFKFTKQMRLIKKI